MLTLKAIWAGLTSFFDGLSRLFKYLSDKQLISSGEAISNARQKTETLETIKDVTRPITDSDRERVWSRLQAERGKE